MSKSNAKYIQPVYDDVIEHLKMYQDKHMPKLHFGSFGPDIPQTSETFSIPMFHLSGLNVDAFVDHCRQHKCYISSQISADRNDRFTLWLHFYWIDRDDVNSNYPPKISKHVTFQDNQSYPSGAEFLIYFALGSVATVFGLTKNTIFGL